MIRINYILNNETYKKIVKELEEIETERIFCKHNLEHFLDVARIAHIINLEENLEIDKEIVYAAALLHDLGRVMEYKYGVPHQMASAEIGEKLLFQCDFDEKESMKILKAITSHRNSHLQDNNLLGQLLYRSDKLSRNCFSCKAQNQCNWTEDKKNYNIIY